MERALSGQVSWLDGHGTRRCRGPRSLTSSRRSKPAAGPIACVRSSSSQATSFREACAITDPRITIDPMRMDGVPCIRGLRIPVSTADTGSGADARVGLLTGHFESDVTRAANRAEASAAEAASPVRT